MIRSSAAEGVACMAMNGRVEKKDVIGRRRAVRIDMVARARIFVDQQGGLAVLPIVLYLCCRFSAPLLPGSRLMIERYSFIKAWRAKIF